MDDEKRSPTVLDGILAVAEAAEANAVALIDTARALLNIAEHIRDTPPCRHTVH